MPEGLGRGLESGAALADAGERTLHVGRDRPIRISSGHRLLHHDGKCSRPHGHNYEVSVRVTGELTAEGWVVDKGGITEVLSEWDHRFLLELGVPYELTWSCYRAEAPACGTCDACAFRLEAFQNLGVRDPIDYAERPAYAEQTD